LFCNRLPVVTDYCNESFNQQLMYALKGILSNIAIIVLFIIIAVVLIAQFNYRLKKRIIESGPLNETSLKFFKDLSGMGSEVLKWGLILLFGGLGLVVLEFVPYSAFSSPLPYGLETVFLGIGFLTYYLLARKEKKSKNNS
jgi:hypothetical protein